MSTGAVIMMLAELGAVWGGAIVTVIIALAADKKSELYKDNNNVVSQ